MSVYTPSASGATIASIGGSGVATQGGQINTVASGGAARNILDDGSGNMTIVGGTGLTVSTGNISVTTAGARINVDKIFSHSSAAVINMQGGSVLVQQVQLVASSGIAVQGIQLQSANYAMLQSDFGVFVTTAASTIVVTLKSTSGAGTLQFVQKVDAGAGTVTLTPDTGTIDGAATKSLTAINMSALCCFDGTNWHIIAWNQGTI